MVLHCLDPCCWVPRIAVKRGEEESILPRQWGNVKMRDLDRPEVIRWHQGLVDADGKGGRQALRLGELLALTWPSQPGGRQWRRLAGGTENESTFFG